MTTLLPLEWPAADRACRDERVWLRAFGEQVARLLAAMEPTIASQGDIRTARVIHRRDLFREIESHAEWSDDEIRTQCAVRDNWETDDEGGWRLVRYTIVARPVNDGRETGVTIEEE